MSTVNLFVPLNRLVSLARPSSFLFSKKTFSKVSYLEACLEQGLNNQITTEFYASFTYLALANYFNKQNVALPGCYKYFGNQVLEEREHAQKIIDYINKRGSTVVLQTIPQPQKQCWTSVLEAFMDALELEKFVSQKLFELHDLATEMGDVCVCNLLENDFLDNQVEEYNALSRHIAQLERIGPSGVGIYIFDQYLLKELKEST